MSQLTFYNDYSSPTRRFRTMMIPGSPATYLPVEPPEWGDDPTPTSSFRKIPDLVILENVNAGKSGHDKIPTGMQSLAGRKLLVNLSRLQGGDLVTAHNDIKSLVPATTTLATVGSGPTLELPNQWLILEGAPGDDIADFTVMFHGVQAPSRTRTFQDLDGHGVGIVLDIVHICDYIVKAVHPDWVNERALAEATTQDDGQLFLHLWKEGTELMSQMAIPEENLPELSATPRFRFRMMRHITHALIVQDVFNECYQWLTRQARSTSTINFAVRSYRSAAPSSSTAGTPRDRADFFEQDYTKDNLAGGLISRDNTYMLAFVIDTDNADAVVAGKLSQGHSEAESMYEWFEEECQGLLAAGRYVVVDQGNAELWFRAPAEAQATHDLETADLVDVSDPRQGEYALKHAEVERPSAGALDVTNSIALGSAHALKTWGSSAVIDVGAVNGETEDMVPYSVANSTGYFPGLSAKIGSAVGLPDGIYDRVYYKASSADVAAGGTKDIFCAAHHKVRLLDGVGGSTDYDVTTPALPATVVGDHKFANLIAGIREVNIAAQLDGGVPGAVARDVIALFGGAAATEIVSGAKRSAMPYTCVGDVVRLVPAVSGDYVGRYLFSSAGDTTLDVIPGVGVVVDVEPDEREDHMTVTLLMLRES